VHRLRRAARAGQDSRSEPDPADQEPAGLPDAAGRARGDAQTRRRGTDAAHGPAAQPVDLARPR
jgi:hypothetical protein